MFQWLEIECDIPKGGSVDQNRLHRPNSVIATCGNCDVRQPFGVQQAGRKSDLPVFAAEGTCIKCSMTQKFVICYPDPVHSEGHIYANRLFQWSSASAVGQSSGLREQEAKIRERLARGDYDGVVSACSTFTEKYLKIELIKLESSFHSENEGDLKKLFKAYCEATGIHPADEKNKALKPLLSALTSLISGIYEIANKLGDRHDAKADIGRAEAKLAFDATMVLCEYLEAQKEGNP